MQKLPEKCPICNANILVTRFFCPQCDSVIEGHFQPLSGPFSELSDEQMNFVLTFIRCEGRFNRMEEELNLSYPTLRNRLFEVIRALGFEPGRTKNPPFHQRIVAAYWMNSNKERYLPCKPNNSSRALKWSLRKETRYGLN